MEKFNDWQSYWNDFLLTRYGKEDVQSEEDLYFQVARTVNRRPVVKDVFDKIIDQVIADLSLSKEDILVDFCCGNGLFTYELKSCVKQIIGVDFSQKIIDTANKYKAADNIIYCLGDVVDYMRVFKQTFPDLVPTKYLMNDSLAYFSPADLEQMLAYIKEASGNFKFLVRGVPNDVLKWNYYDTEERKKVYLDNISKGDLTNAGLGSWWVPEEIMEICDKLHLKCSISNQQLPISDYRMDIMISNS